MTYPLLAQVDAGFDDHNEASLAVMSSSCPSSIGSSFLPVSSSCLSRGNLSISNSSLFSGASVVPASSHSAQGRYACELCGKHWDALSKLEIHLRSHTKFKPHVCDVCRRAFTVASNLKRHMKTVHATERRFGCECCDKRFNQLCNLKRHERVHTGEKPFSCNICFASFADQTVMRQHMKIHGNDDKENLQVDEEDDDVNFPPVITPKPIRYYPVQIISPSQSANFAYIVSKGSIPAAMIMSPNLRLEHHQDPDDAKHLPQGSLGVPVDAFEILPNPFR